MKRKSDRRWYRISLFNALIIFSLLSIGLAIYGQIRSRAIKQESAVLKFLNSQSLDHAYVSPYYTLRAGSLLYDFEIQGYDANQAVYGSQPEPSWLAHWFGLDMVHSVQFVEFSRENPDLETIRVLRDFPGLKRVDFAQGMSEQLAWDELMNISSLQNIEFCIEPSAYRGEELPPSVEFAGLSKLTYLNEFVLQCGDFTTANIRHVADCKNLKTLRLLDVHIRRNDLLNFPQMEPVTAFYWSIYKNPVDNDEFRFIESFPNLEKFAMSGNWEITDQIFASLEKLPDLTEISLHGTNLTGSQLHRLNHSRLTKLELGASQLDDAGIAALAELTNLTHLEIGSTNVTDVGMPSIARLTKLRHLSIRDTTIGDVGLQAISALTELRFLRIRDTQITDAGVAAFREGHPNCAIDLN